MPTDACPGSRLETLWTLVKPDSRRQFVLCTVYRPPRHTVADLTADFTDLQAQLQHVIISYPHLKLLISGDLNCCLLKRDTEPAKRCLLEFVSDNSLVQ